MIGRARGAMREMRVRVANLFSSLPRLPTAMVVGVAMVCAGCVAAQPQGATLAPGDTPPGYLGDTAAGKAVHLSALRGEVVVVSFWATWCPYCMQELPVLARIQAAAARKGLPMQVVAVNYKESRRLFFHSAAVLHARFPNLLVTWDHYGSIGRPYGTGVGIPVMVMLHPDGTIAYIHLGYAKSEFPELIREINGLLEEAPAAPRATAGN